MQYKELYGTNVQDFGVRYNLQVVQHAKCLVFNIYGRLTQSELRPLRT